MTQYVKIQQRPNRKSPFAALPAREHRITICDLSGVENPSTPGRLKQFSAPGR